MMTLHSYLEVIVLGRIACILGFHRVITTRKVSPKGSYSVQPVAYTCYRPGCSFGGVWVPTFDEKSSQRMTASATVKLAP